MAMSHQEPRESSRAWNTCLVPLLAASFVVSACTNEEDATPSPSTWEIDLPSDTLNPAGTVAVEQTDCGVSIDSIAPQGEFLAPSTEATREDASYIGSIPYFLERHQGLTPLQLVDAYLLDQAPKPTRADISLKFDPGLIAESWTYAPNPDGSFNMDYAAEQQSLIYKVENLLLALSDYPQSMLDILGIKTIRLADIYEDYAGHYDRQNGEVLLEFDAFNGSEASLEQLRGAVAHEIVGHGFHDLLCEDGFQTDLALSSLNTMAYIGYLPDNSTDEQQTAHYDRARGVSSFAAGANRIFAREYGAVSVYEDFATIVEFSLEYRGLIMPGDADYGSPLQLKQQLIIDRIEKITPGFRAYVEARSRLLRQQPKNEIYSVPLGELVVPYEYADLAVPEGGDYTKDCFEPDENGQVTILDGAIFFDGHSGDGRGGFIAINPAVQIDSTGKVAYFCARGDFSINAPIGSRQYYFFPRVPATSHVNRIDHADWEAQVMLLQTGTPEADYVFAGLAPLPVLIPKQS